jgi:hypothetical protein
VQDSSIDARESTASEGVPRPRILTISFSPLISDARVLRQIGVLSEFGDVTSVGYGPQPPGAVAHLTVPDEDASLPRTPVGVAMLALRRHKAAELAAPAVKTARALIGDGTFDLVVANDARALSLAFAVAGAAPVWADMHEWAPEEQSHQALWRLLVAPLMVHECRTYLPRAAAVTTVSPLIARLYEREFGVRPAVVRNSRAFAELMPSPVSEDAIRLVHSGVAAPERCIEVLIDATLALDERFTLDLYLVEGGGGDRYLRTLQARAGGSPRVRFHDPVPTSRLVEVLNAYDLGVYVLRPTTTNHRLMFPNKFFDFVQARLGLVFGPAEELDGLIAEHGLGVTTPGYDAEDLVAALAPLAADDVTRFKAAADAAAGTLSSEADVEVQRAVARRVLGR